MIPSTTLDLTCDLIRRRSVTPDDDGCQNILIERLEKLNFNITRLPFGEVTNFWAVRGASGPLLVFAGHTDVVPAGNENDWVSEPLSFETRF